MALLKLLRMRNTVRAASRGPGAFARYRARRGILGLVARLLARIGL